MKKTIIFIILLFILSGCVGTGSKGVFGTGVSVAFDPRTVGTQIDDSIMEKNLVARLTLEDKKYLISVKVKVIDGRFFLTGKVENPEEKGITHQNFRAYILAVGATEDLQKFQLLNFHLLHHSK